MSALVFLSALSGYLMGSLSFTRIITKIVSPGLDLSSVKMKNPETGEDYPLPPTSNTASIALGWKAGCLIGLLDMAKAMIPVLAWRVLFPDQPYHLAAAVFAVVGNNWPLYYRFKGGGGLSAIYGGLLVISPLGILVTTLAGILLGLIVLRSMKLTMVLPILLLIPWFWYRTGETLYVIYAVSLNACFFVPFLLNIRNYLPKDGSTAVSERAIMEQMPMGRGMLKILDKMGLKKK